MTDILVLDVGHGNSALLTNGHTTVVIDAPSDVTLLRTLRRREVQAIDHLVVSHADEDHAGGVVPILLARDISVRHVHLNPDPTRQTRGWERLVAALEVAEQAGTEIHPEVSTNSGPRLSFDDCRIDVLFPSAATAVRGVGGRLGGARLSANSMSAVVRVEVAGNSVLFAGDADRIALESMRSRGVMLDAEVLIYPHHGGRAVMPSSPMAEQLFARDLTAAVGPRTVAFSHGRARHANPKPDAVKGVRTARPDARIVCTQLSSHCASVVGSSFGHLTGDLSSGERHLTCCAGTLRLSADAGEILPAVDAHQEFIAATAETPMCMSADLSESHGAARPDE